MIFNLKLFLQKMFPLGSDVVYKYEQFFHYTDLKIRSCQKFFGEWYYQVCSSQVWVPHSSLVLIQNLTTPKMTRSGKPY
jgi:hypothetical protein